MPKEKRRRVSAAQELCLLRETVFGELQELGSYAWQLQKELYLIRRLLEDLVIPKLAAPAATVTMKSKEPAVEAAEVARG